MKPNYGIDAPNIILGLFLFGILCIVIGILFPEIQITRTITLVNTAFFAWAIILFLEGLLMFLYSKFGKVKHRDRILNMVDWKGSELVLDVGTGAGLLMIGAAKKLNNGKSYGIDIWSKKDLSKNNSEQTLKNAELEKVSEKIELKNEDITNLSFEDNYFDIVVSNLCLHNISGKENRIKACKEISRVLKPNGKAIISDMKYMNEYKSAFDSLGLSSKISKPFLLNTFPPLRIISVEKPST